MTDYEKYYQGAKKALGEPTIEFVQFFATYPKINARVLDVGCGQGRDALFIARLGYQVVGVDLSSTGISDMLDESDKDKLGIVGEVADIRDYDPIGEFDVILIDRTLHMLDEADRLKFLTSLIKFVAEKGVLLIADEKSNISGFNQVLDTSDLSWKITKQKKGYLFAARID